jgi:hypothetical protein
MFGADFGEKCIIMHFLGVEKERKSSQRRGAEKRLGQTGRQKEERLTFRERELHPPPDTQPKVAYE